MSKLYTVEELLLDDSFIDYCRDPHASHHTHWRQLAAADPNQRRVMEEAAELLAMLGPQLGTAAIADEVNKLRELVKTDTIPFSIPAEDSLFVSNKGKIYRKRIVQLAMAAMILLAVCFAGYRWMTKTTEPSRLAASFSTGNGERKKVKLPDGSIVTLNSNSSLSIQTDFNTDERKINFTGSAFFEVAKNADKKFVVVSNTCSTTAIGTAFYVQADPAAADYKVELLEGKVKVDAAAATPAYLEAGSRASWHSTGQIAVESFDTLYLKNWVSGRISFTKTPIKEAFEQLGKWYGTTIEDQRAKADNDPITGEYANESLEDILKVICFSNSCHYKLNGTKFIIY